MLGVRAGEIVSSELITMPMNFDQMFQSFAMKKMRKTKQNKTKQNKTKQKQNKSKTDKQQEKTNKQTKERKKKHRFYCKLSFCVVSSFLCIHGIAMYRDRICSWTEFVCFSFSTLQQPLLLFTL